VNEKALVAKMQAQREGGKILATILKAIESHTEAGVTGIELDKLARTLCDKHQVEAVYLKEAPAFGYAICISKNDVLIHGIPDEEPLRDGDKVSFDMTIRHRGWCVDSAFTILVGGEGSSAAKHLLNATQQSFYAGITGVKAGSLVGQISHQIEQFLYTAKLGVIKDFIGHGIGRTMHEAPEVPNFGNPKSGAVLKAGQTICIEPMTSLGGITTKIDPGDGWSVRLTDGSLGAHYEHTVLILDHGVEILTAW